MLFTRVATAAASILFSLHAVALAGNFKIDNPASNIYNPAAHMDNPSPISPPTQPIQPPAATKEITPAIPAAPIKDQPLPQAKIAIPYKNYNFMSVKAYLAAAKKAFNRDNFIEFVSITEDALRRINAGTLRASKTSKQKLARYKKFGYELLEENAE